MSPILGILASSVQKAPPGYDSIATVVGNGSNTTTLSFNTVPTSYASLQIRAMWAYDGTGVNTVQGVIYFNGDAVSTNYYQRELQGNGATVAAARSTGSIGGIALNSCVPAVNSTSIMGTAIIDITNANTSSRASGIRALHGCDLNAANTDATVTLTSGVHLNLSSVSSISLTMTTGRVFSASTVISLYGLKAAA